VSTPSDQAGNFQSPVAVSRGAWVLSAESPIGNIQWRLSLDVPGPDAMFADLNVPAKLTSFQLVDAIRSIDAEAPSVELVRKFIQFYPGLVGGSDAVLGGVNTSNDGKGRRRASAEVVDDDTASDPGLEDEPPSVVTFSPDYMAPSPLWPQSDTTDAMVPEALLVKLIAWQQEFDSNFRWEMGWISDEAKAEWAKEAVELEAELRDALAGMAELVVDLWPLREGVKDTGVDRPE
jgi:hypothetical protein